MDKSVIARMEWIASKVLKRLPGGSAVCRVARKMLAEWTDGTGEWTNPPAEVMRAMHTAFVNLAAEEQCRVLNGWRFLSSYPTVSDVLKFYAEYGGTVYRFAYLSEWNDDVSCFHEFGTDQADHPTPLSVKIGEGSSREQVERGLVRILETVRTQWDAIVSDTLGQQKSGTPETPTNPTPASNRVEKVQSPAAA